MLRASPSVHRYVLKQKSRLINLHEENCLRETKRCVQGVGGRQGGNEGRREGKGEGRREGGERCISMGTQLQGHICVILDSLPFTLCQVMGMGRSFLRFLP